MHTQYTNNLCLKIWRDLASATINLTTHTYLQAFCLWIICLCIDANTSNTWTIGTFIEGAGDVSHTRRMNMGCKWVSYKKGWIWFIIWMNRANVFFFPFWHSHFERFILLYVKHGLNAERWTLKAWFTFNRGMNLGHHLENYFQVKLFRFLESFPYNFPFHQWPIVPSSDRTKRENQRKEKNGSLVLFPSWNKTSLEFTRDSGSITF